MKKILMFIEKYWIYFIIAIIGVSLVLVAFNLLGINIINWLKDNMKYIAIIMSVIIIILTMYISKKYSK